MDGNSLDGVKMLHHDEIRNYARIQRKLLDVFSRYGCKLVETPNFADYDMCSTVFPDLRKEMVKTVDADGTVLVLRPDVTLPIVETAAREYPQARKLLKFAYVSTVFRNYSGRSTYGRDFLQGGAEILGIDSAECDGEVISMAADLLTSVGVEDMHIDLGNAAYGNALFDGSGLKEEEKRVLRRLLSERDIVAYHVFTDSLALEQSYRDVLDALPMLFGPYSEISAKARAYCLNRAMHNALTRLEEINRFLTFSGYRDTLQLDLGFAGPLGYYTDMIFKIYANGAFCELISGGRYNTLSRLFGVDRPACGFGMNINILYEFMKDGGLLKDNEPASELAVMYDHCDERLVADVFRWRRLGCRIGIYNREVFIDTRDYKSICQYSGGVYSKDGKELSAADMEELVQEVR